MPFRKSLRTGTNVILPLTTLVERFMGRTVDLQGDIPVRPVQRLSDRLPSNARLDKVEQARAALDLFRSCEHIWEELIETGGWPCALPPVTHANCFS